MRALRLSVVIPAISGAVPAQACADSIRRLPGAEAVEIVVVPSRPGAKLCELRAEGRRRATAPTIAIMGDRYEVTPQWLAAALQETEFDATGGCVSPSPRLSYFGWCVYLSEYAQLAPPLIDGATGDPRGLPGGNTLYRTAALDPRRLAASATELDYHSGLLATGATAGRLSRLEVVFTHPPGLREYLRERFAFSRDIARERTQRWRLFLSPLLPLAVLVRTAQASILRGRFAGHWVICAPVILACSLVQAAGDFLGHASAGMSS